MWASFSPSLPGAAAVLKKNGGRRRKQTRFGILFSRIFLVNYRIFYGRDKNNNNNNK
jgi:uncharacterized protein Veg